MPKLGRRSEVTELDYQTSMALTTTNAPFGTEHTPNLKEKIIGGRYVSVLERPPGQNVPRYEKLTLVSDKPNHVDPRALNDFSRRHNKPYQEARSYPGSPEHSMGNRWNHPSQDPFSKNRTMPHTNNYISKRPDSKDISSRYPTLPPIDENRLKNHQISTVFEPEAWTSQYRSNTDDKENQLRRAMEANGRSYDRGSREEQGSGPYASRHSEPPPSPRPMYDRRRGQGPLSKEAFVRKLTSMLPKNVFLPEHPLLLSEDDETRLLQVIGEEMSGRSPLKLRDIYLDIANTSDKNLSGYCQYQDLYYAMGRQMISLSGDLLQVTAAMFVSPDRPNRDVNYEKVLSFLGLAVKHFAKTGAPEQNRKPSEPVERQVDNYMADSEQVKLVSTVERQVDNYMADSEQVKLVSTVERQVDNYMADSEQAKLVSTVEQQLRENEYVIDFSKLDTQLAMADRQGRGVLDLRTIMDVCFQLNIPLQSSVLNRVLQRCRLNSYEDNYNWSTFVDFLTKAQPARLQFEPARFQPSSPLRHNPPTPRDPAEKAPATPLWRRHEGPAQSNGLGNGSNEGQEPRNEVISRMDQDIKQLERNYDNMRDQLNPRDRNDAPWFQNFMEFANALYEQDQRHQGNLPAEDVFRWSKMYNDTGNLGMSDAEIARALSEASKGGKVHIHTFLTKLGNVARHDKIV